MKLNKLTKTGFYTCDLDKREAIYEVINNSDENWLKEYPEQTLLIDKWTLDHIDEEGRRCYKIYGGNLIPVLNAEDIDVYEITDTNYIMKYKEMCIADRMNGTAMREDKPTRLEKYKECLDEIEHILEVNKRELDECLCNDIDGQILQKIRKVMGR